MPDDLHLIDAREVLRRHGLEYNAFDRPAGIPTTTALLALEAEIDRLRQDLRNWQLECGSKVEPPGVPDW